MTSVHHHSGLLALGAVGVLMTLAGVAQAGSANFATTNIQYLHGTRYADFDPNGGFSEDDEAGILTLQHLNT